MPTLYLPGNFQTRHTPLARFLPPIPDGIAVDWLVSQPARISPLSWILDPFGASPRTAVELARAGYRVLVAASNPIARFLIEMTAQPPPESEFHAALAELATSKKGDERLETHIRNLYTTDCAHCGRLIEADAYIWEREASAPTLKIYNCPFCGDHGEHPATPLDVERSKIPLAGFHRSRAIERVSPLNDPDRPHTEEALIVYPPRAVYALFTMINKIDGIPISQLRKRCLQALLLTTCDHTNTLWAYPTTRERPRILSIPPRYRENNVWRIFETSVSQWISKDQDIPLYIWPQTPQVDFRDSGLICVFEGRFREYASELNKLRIGTIITSVPRPNQAFWTLSALWAGWLWGHEAVGPFKTVLRRRRYDWAWHTAALTSTLKTVTAHIADQTPILGLLGEIEAGFLKAVLIAADLAGFDLCSLGLREENTPAYLEWKKGVMHPENIPTDQIELLIQKAAEEYLTERGEPADYLHLNAAVVGRLSVTHAFRWSSTFKQTEKQEEQPADIFNHVQQALRDIFTYRGGFLRYGASEADTTGLWWLKDAKETSPPLADRVEIEIVRFLMQHPGCTLNEIEHSLWDSFSGLLYPNTDLIQACIESYAEQKPSDSDQWFIRPTDFPDTRRSEYKLVQRHVTQLGERLGFTTQGDSPLIWFDKYSNPQYWLYIKASAIYSDIVLNSRSPAMKTILIIPGSRVNLILFKQRKDPRLNQKIQAGCRFLKYRHLRWLLETPYLEQKNFDDQLNRDPLTYTTPQLRLF